MKTILHSSSFVLGFLLSLSTLAAKPSCCAESEAAAYTTESIYQLDARYTTDSGKAFDLGSLKGRPVVIAMFFSSCTYACPLLLGDMARIRAGLPANLKNAAFVLVSFDVARDQPATLKAFRETRQLDEDWILLHGVDSAVRELAALLGVKYKQQADGSFNHSNLITVLNTQGEIVHQRSGLQGDVQETVRAVVEKAMK